MMRWSRASTKPLVPSWLEDGKTVRTPSGSLARVVECYFAGEALEVIVQWPNAERAAFRASILRELP